ncbi:MAG: hypothetical protein AAGD96_11645 [Chloroflexota bacterium]
MPNVSLNLRQKKLIQELAELKKSNQLIEPINPFPLGLMSYVVYLRSRYNLRIQYLSDLEVLALAGYLKHEWNRSGMDKVYRVTPLAGKLLDDPNFITSADYEAYRHLQAMSEFIDDESQQPPANEFMQELIMADFRHLSLILKQHSAAVLGDFKLGTVVSEISAVIRHLDYAEPDKAEISKAIKVIGDYLLSAVNANLESPSSDSKTFQALAAFALWSEKINQKLVRD